MTTTKENNHETCASILREEEKRHRTLVGAVRNLLDVTKAVDLTDEQVIAIQRLLPLLHD